MDTKHLEIQLLLEIALRQQQEGNATDILGAALPVYLRKLSCFMTAVLSNERTHALLPKAMQHDQAWAAAKLAILARLASSPQERIVLEQGGNWFYVYPLSTFGSLVLGKRNPLSMNIEHELLKVAAQLGHNLCYAEETSRMESIFAEMTDVVWSLGWPDRQVLFVTPSVERLYGVSAEAWAANGLGWERYMHQADEALVPGLYAQLEQEGHFSARYRIVTPAGEAKWVRNKAKMVFDSNGLPIRVDGIVMDRSSQYEAQEQLRQELHLQEALIDIASTYINLDLGKVEATINQSLEKMGRFVSADRAYIFDYDFDAQTTSNTYEWCNDGISPEIDNLQEVPMAYFPQWIAQHKKGEAFYVQDVEAMDDESEDGLKAILEPQGIKSLIAIPMLDGKELIGFVGFDSVRSHYNYSGKEQRLLFLFGQMLINIQNRKKWENQLSVQEEKYRNIIANMNLGLLEVDNDDTILFANQSFCDMSGFLLEELRGRKAASLLAAPSHYPAIAESHARRAKGIVDGYEIQVCNKQGQARWWFISGAPNYNDKGQLIGSIGIHLDITEQKRLEQELDRAKSFAEAAAKAKELFLANMSHEIRTPLNVVIGMIRQLAKTSVDEQQLFYVRQAGGAAKHLLTILNNVLDVAKIESKELELQANAFSMSALAYNVHSILHSQAKEKNLEFRLNVSKDIKPALMGDETRIRQVLINLVGNAIKFTEQGSISLSIDVLADKGEAQRLRFEVLDTGIGMSSAFVSRIFDKFSQEDNLSNRKYEGTGLGMAISNDLVSLMGGKLEVESQEGTGSAFHFELELPVGNDEDLVRPSTQLKPGAFKGKKVLLVEDNTMNRFIAAQSLEHLGFVIEEAANGIQAIERVAAGRFDLILMDIQMPEMDGVEATQHIRGEMGVDTPIIALTANAFKHDIDLYLSIGMNDFITKPYDEQDFFFKVEHTLSLHAASSKLGKKPQAAVPTLYDLAYLEQVSRGNTEFVRKMAVIFCEMMATETKAMEEALAKEELGALQKIVHKLKPSIDHMGIASLRDPIRELERYEIGSEGIAGLARLVEKVVEDLRMAASQIKRDGLIG